MPTTTYIFNQYYIDLLKRVKSVAKENKENSTTAQAIYKTIKENYTSIDKTSDEYVVFVKQHITDEVWDKLVDDFDNWLSANKDLELYDGITIGNISKLLDDEYLCYHFITVFYIFRNELTDEVSSNIVKILQTIDGKELLEQLEDDKVKKVLNSLREFRDKAIKEKAGINMNFIEDTTLGKLAKEILEDVDVGKLQKSMENNNDILKAIGDPDSGFADIITNVSKKMANKISNGELNQQNLIQDAVKFASIMPNLFGANGPNTSKGSRKGKKANGPDLSNIMNMMSSMMGNMNCNDDSNDSDDSACNKHSGKHSGKNKGDFNDMMQSMQKMMQQNVPKGAKRGLNESALKKIAKAKKLRNKLMKKKKAAEVVSVSDATTDTQE